MRVYLAGAINGCTDEQANGWRDMVIEDLAARAPEIRPVNPLRRDYRGVETQPGVARRIKRGDLVDIEACDALLANCPQPSWGTGMEIMHAHNTGKLVICVLPADILALGPSPWLIEHSDWMLHTYEDAVDVLVAHYEDLFRKA